MTTVTPALAYRVLTLELTGHTPYLHHSADVDRQSEDYKEYIRLTKATRRTEDQEERIAYLDWFLGLHWNPKLGPFIPANQLQGAIAKAAAKHRLATETKRSSVVGPYEIPLEYRGPRDIDGLWNQHFAYSTMVATAGANRGRINRTRGCFETWKARAEVAYDPEELPADLFQTAVLRSGRYGVGDGRNMGFGRFTIAIASEEEVVGDLSTYLSTSSRRIDKMVHDALRNNV